MDLGPGRILRGLVLAGVKSLAAVLFESRAVGHEGLELLV